MMKSTSDNVDTGIDYRAPQMTAELSRQLLQLCAAVVNAKEARTIELWNSGINQEKLSQLTVAWDDSTAELALWMIKQGFISAQPNATEKLKH